MTLLAYKDFRTPEAKKWPNDFIPPETCAAIDDAQNALEHLRDSNSQLRHAAHHWKNIATRSLEAAAKIMDAEAEWCYDSLQSITNEQNSDPINRLTLRYHWRDRAKVAEEHAQSIRNLEQAVFLD